MKNKKQVIRMTSQQIRVEIKKMDDKVNRLIPCHLSFDELKKSLESSPSKQE